MIELDRRLRKLTFDDVVDWMDDRYAARAWNYRERVGDVFATEDGYWATVQGTEPYAVKLSADSSGGFVSECSCPIGGDCKHAGALAFVVSEKLKEGVKLLSKVPQELLDSLAASRDRPRMPRKRAPKPEERFNPFAPIPSFALDFASSCANGPIRFPDNRFQTRLGLTCAAARQKRSGMCCRGSVLKGARWTMFDCLGIA